MSDVVELTEVDLAILRGQAVAEAYMELTGKSLADERTDDVLTNVIADMLLWANDKTTTDV